MVIVRLALSGKTPSDSHRANLSAAIKRLPKKECPYCHLEFGPQAFGRWHGDKCKIKQQGTDKNE